MLHQLIQEGVSDIYIVEELGFEIKNVAQIAHSKNVNIRVFPDVAQSAAAQTPALKKFFIRPEDTELYSQYVDVLEFSRKGAAADTLYKVYAEDKEWYGKLKELIISFNDETDNRGILPLFALRRLECGKRCLKGNSCHLCESFSELSEMIRQYQSLN